MYFLYVLGYCEQFGLKKILTCFPRGWWWYDLFLIIIKKYTSNQPGGGGLRMVNNTLFLRPWSLWLISRYRTSTQRRITGITRLWTPCGTHSKWKLVGTTMRRRSYSLTGWTDWTGLTGWISRKIENRGKLTCLPNLVRLAQQEPLKG